MAVVTVPEPKAHSILTNEYCTPLNGGNVTFWTAGGPETGTLLGTMGLSATAFAAPAARSAALNAVTQDAAADATGTAAVAVFRTSANAEVFRGPITATGGGGVIEMPSTSITAGEPIQISSGSISHP